LPYGALFFQKGEQRRDLWLFQLLHFFDGGPLFYWFGIAFTGVLNSCSGSDTDLSIILILFAVFASWLKIKLTLMDFWAVGDKASRRIAISIVSVLCWPAVYWGRRLP
jgi:hypothetical protein